MLRPHQIRWASTSSHSFPFPSHSYPTPWQIFHLSPGASQKDIKARYYELVRVHHPDSAQCRNLAPEVRHARFQSISHAYDALRGRRSPEAAASDPFRQELERRRRQRHFDTAAHPRRDFEAQGADDRWKDRLIIAVGLVSLAVGLGPALIFGGPSDQQHRSAAANLAQARAEAREFGEQRRLEIKRRVREHREQAALQDSEQSSDSDK
ncbi:hypothetical protein PHLGIDRAFT_427093 [Phlebiopsis gigantea 11061_1 CR5-6]|uniref:J domain-containing protein n=1 Tax=Phlebiopsis gigantea (strain 11061_1 CR5-6) TaxID=745531 RepID=A0A0C3NPZ4_PHLG1|nr:hypothetical protein PHLGIDRAFT_427093 [Phlebiopsis gigantea 11061_1 CR5-6]